MSPASRRVQSSTLLSALLAPLLLAGAAAPVIAQMGRSGSPAATALPPAAPTGGPTVRVLLAAGSSWDLPSQVLPLRLLDARQQPLRLLAPEERLRLTATSAGVVAEVVSPEGATRRLPPQAAGLWLEPVAEKGQQTVLAFGKERYRGRVFIRLNQAGSLMAINHLPLETYLASVVGSEMPASWPQAALRAQAVAARTYALSHLKPAAAYDVKSTVASQAYRGLAAETDSTRAAVAATTGKVLMQNGKLILAAFHSSSGGSTESSGDLWPRQMPYLVSVPDFDHESPVRAWRQPLDPAVLSRAFAEIGGARQIEVLSTTPTGRVRQARVTGANGVLVLSGAQLRSRLGLKSTWVRFELEQQPPGLAAAGTEGLQLPVLPPPPLAELAASSMAAPPPARLVAVGRGFGHGVGMSQWGAYAMARRGESFSQILSHYYRGAQLRSYSELALSAAAAPGSRLNGSSALASSSAPRP